MEKEIRIIGRGSVSRRPDYTVIELTFVDDNVDYSALIKKSAEDLAKVKTILEEEKIPTDAIKTKDFSIRPVYKSIKDKKGNTTEKFAHFTYRQTLKFKYKSDNKKLGNILYKISANDLKAKFDIDFEFVDDHSCRDDALKAALADAKRQADIICNATGAEIDSVKLVSYDFDDYDGDYGEIRRGGSYREMLCYNSAVKFKPESYNIDILPNDVEVNMSVKVVYLLK